MSEHRSHDFFGESAFFHCTGHSIKPKKIRLVFIDDLKNFGLPLPCKIFFLASHFIPEKFCKLWIEQIPVLFFLLCDIFRQTPVEGPGMMESGSKLHIVLSDFFGQFTVQITFGTNFSNIPLVNIAIPQSKTIMVNDTDSGKPGTRFLDHLCPLSCIKFIRGKQRNKIRITKISGITIALLVVLVDVAAFLIHFFPIARASVFRHGIKPPMGIDSKLRIQQPIRCSVHTK